MSSTVAAVTLDEAAELTRTGDVWIFRGRSTADRAIRLMTNAPVNHVGMAVVLEDLPPLMWHAELGKSLLDMWSGDHHRGVQLHDLREAVTRWTTVYGQQAWFRQLHPEVGALQEDAVLRSIARWDGASFPNTSSLSWRWLRGRTGLIGREVREVRQRAKGLLGTPERGESVSAGAVYCAEVVAATYEAMGLVDPDVPHNWYDPGRFWSGDRLPLAPGWSLGGEIPVTMWTPPAHRVPPAHR